MACQFVLDSHVNSHSSATTNIFKFTRSEIWLTPGPANRFVDMLYEDHGKSGHGPFTYAFPASCYALLSLSTFINYSPVL
jgi:hypothetical protein